METQDRKNLFKKHNASEEDEADSGRAAFRAWIEELGTKIGRSLGPALMDEGFDNLKKLIRYGWLSLVFDSHELTCSCCGGAV
jgi:hypothetical protein